MKLKFRGKVHLIAKDVITGKIVYEFEDHNLIVTTGLGAILNLMTASGDIHRISKCGFGTSDTPPEVTDTSLSSDAVIKTMGTSVVSDPPADITYTILLNPEEGNGKTIAEVGLFTDQNILVARRVLDNPIVKTEHIGIEGNWTISIEQEVE